MVVSTDIGLHHPKKRFSPMPYSFPSPHDHDAADDSGMIPSKKRRSTIVSSCSSSSFSSSCCPSLSTDSDTNTRSTAVDLEKRVQLALQMDSLHVLEDVDLEHESMLIRQEELDSLCARDFSRLSLQEREDILHDIHGVREIIQEKPSFCQQQTRQLEEELKNRIDGATTRRRDQPKGTTSVNRPYSMALKQDESYVRSCQTMFLRASRWDPQKAADGMIGFFQKKLILFGRTALTEKITIEKHLSKSDQQALESGCFQLLPVRDNGGRAIVVAFPPVRSYKDPDSLVSTQIWKGVYFPFHEEEFFPLARFRLLTLPFYRRSLSHASAKSLLLYRHDGTGRCRDPKKGCCYSGVQYGEYGTVRKD